MGKADNVGAVIQCVGGYTEDYIRKHAPDLLPVYLTLLPFSYLFASTSAGPQKQAKGYDPDEPQHIDLRINDPRYSGGEDDGESLWCHITADSITMQWLCLNGANGEDYSEDSEITLIGLWDYLRQIPKPYQCFCKGGE
jgi:hypothetical protein